MSSSHEFSHYVVSAHAPGAVLNSTKCNFLAPDSLDVLVAKSSRLEVRQLRSSNDENNKNSSSDTFPTVLNLPIHGRLTVLEPIKVPSLRTSAVFLLEDQDQYAVISYSPKHQGSTTKTTSGAATTTKVSPYPVSTHASGSLKNGGGDNGRSIDGGAIVAVDPLYRCIALHSFEGLLTILPIDQNYTAPAAGNPKDDTSAGQSSRSSNPRRPKELLGTPFHCRLEEHTILAMAFLHTSSSSELTPPPLQLAVLYQDSRGSQHLTTHVVNLQKQMLNLYGSQSVMGNVQWLKKTNLDGGSAMLIPVEPTSRQQQNTAAAASAANTDPSPAQQPSAPGLLIIGQRQFTYCSCTTTKVIPVPQALFLAYEPLPSDPSTGMPRFLLADEFGNLHMLSLMTVNGRVVALQLETLGSCTLASTLAYLGEGLLYVGSTLGDSQLVQIHDEPIPNEVMEHGEDMEKEGGDETDILMDTTYLSVIEEYTNLGPIIDFDLVPTTPGGSAPTSTSKSGPAQNQIVQSQVVTASGSSKSGSIRVIRNGIGMNEYAAVEIPGIQAMWNLRKSYQDNEDTYLVQSFVGETRVLGVTKTPSDDRMEDDAEDSEEISGTLEEVVLPGLKPGASTLYVGNVYAGDRLLQITETEARLISWSGEILNTWSNQITVASANEAGQIAIAVQGGKLVYLTIEDDKIVKQYEVQMEREVSCLDIHPFLVSESGESFNSSMDIDGAETNSPSASAIVAVGLWDDFTVRLLSLNSGLDELVCINLSTDEEAENEDLTGSTPSRRNRNNMMARSLSLITLDFSSAAGGGNGYSASMGVNMLFVGLGDGTLISFAVVSRRGVVSVQSKKEVCLGTQRIDLVPLKTEQGGSCVLATGDRPTVIYLAGVGGTTANQFNPKLCYSNVNVAEGDDEDIDDVSRPPAHQSIAVNVAAPFFSPLLFDAASLGKQHYSLCVADDASLRLGVIDDIQKLHVTTCRLGMAPRRIVHCPDGRLFAVGCIESGIQNFGHSSEETSMGNCIRFMDDTTFDDLERIDLEPFEMILSMLYASMKVPSTVDSAVADATSGSNTDGSYKSFLLVGTAYAIPDEDEPTRGRILVYSCQGDESSGTTSTNSRAVRQITEFSTEGGVYSMCQFYEGKILVSVNSKVHLCRLVQDTGLLKLQYEGHSHFGQILSLTVKSRAQKISTETSGSAMASGEPLAMEVADVQEEKKKEDTEPTEMLAVVGDLMRSVSLLQYYPEHQTLEEVSRDFNNNWMCSLEMLTENVYIGAENWNNLFCLRRNTAATSEEIRCRLDTIGEFHLGEMCNKFMSGTLVMPVSTNNTASNRRNLRRGSPQKKTKSDSPSKGGAGSRLRRPVVSTGSQTLFGTVDGTLGVILGLDARTSAFFSTLERAIGNTIQTIGNFSHQQFRALRSEKRKNPAYGFIDGDLVESFLDLDRSTMEAVVIEMNRDGGWDFDDAIMRNVDEQKEKSTEQENTPANPEDELHELHVEDVLAMVEEMTMLH